MKANPRTARAVIATIAAGREGRVRLAGAVLRPAATAVGRAPIGPREIGRAAPGRAEIVRGTDAPRSGAMIRGRLRNPDPRSGRWP